jgi:hypothetical protein
MIELKQTKSGAVYAISHEPTGHKHVTLLRKGPTDRT